MKKIQDPALIVSQFVQYNKAIEDKNRKIKEEYEKKVSQVDYEIKQLKFEEERLLENAKRNSAAKKMEQELQQLTAEKNKILQQKSNYIREVASLESKISKCDKESRDDNPKAALSLYKSIANVGITSVRNKKIRGVIAGGTRTNTKFFEYDLSRDNVSNIFWNDLKSVSSEN